MIHINNHSIPYTIWQLVLCSNREFWVYIQKTEIPETVTWLLWRHIHILLVTWYWTFSRINPRFLFHIRHFRLDMYGVRFCLNGHWTSLLLWCLGNFCNSLRKTILFRMRKIIPPTHMYLMLKIWAKQINTWITT